MTTNNPLPDDIQGVLRELTISEDAPGPILRDFETFLDFVEDREARVGGTRGMLHLTALAPLNARLVRSVDVRLQRPIQKSYPYVNGLFLLARTIEIVRVEGTGSAQTLAPNLPVLQSWRALNTTERYFALLDAWLFESDAETIGERGGAGAYNSSLALTLNFLDGLPREGRTVKPGANDAQRLNFFPGLHNLALLDLFGFVAVTAGAPGPKGAWTVDRIDWTPVGRAFFEALVRSGVGTEHTWRARASGLAEMGKLGLDEGEEERDDDVAKKVDLLASVFGVGAGADLLASILGGSAGVTAFPMDDDDGDGEDYEEDDEDGDGEPLPSVLRPVLGEYFPEWERSLAASEDESRTGVHVFKVSLGKVWRTIAISGEDTLDDLAYAILRSVKFDDDHLFMFTFKDRRGVSVEANHPYTRPLISTDDVEIGEVPLSLGQSMKFVFDFGDWWEFDVKLLDVEADAKLKKPKVRESHGAAPKQYRNWDEE